MDRIVFDNVSMPPGRAFIVITEYGNTAYNTDVGQAEVGKNSLNLPLEIYESTSDPSILKVDRLHLFFEFVDSQDRAGGRAIRHLEPDR